MSEQPSTKIRSQYSRLNNIAFTHIQGRAFLLHACPLVCLVFALHTPVTPVYKFGHTEDLLSLVARLFSRWKPAVFLAVLVHVTSNTYK